MSNPQPEQSSKWDRSKAYLKKIGWAGIVFFTIKGIISTSIILFGIKSCTG
jgi:hypothetical protein